MSTLVNLDFTTVMPSVNAPQNPTQVAVALVELVEENEALRAALFIVGLERDTLLLEVARLTGKLARAKRAARMSCDPHAAEAAWR